MPRLSERGLDIVVRLFLILGLSLPIFIYFSNVRSWTTYSSQLNEIGIWFVAALSYLIFAIQYLRKVVKPNIFETLAVLIFTFAVTMPFVFAISYKRIMQQDSCLAGIVSEKWDPIYFSYTTFTTLGYGDITPVGACRFISSAEAVTGYLLLGLLTAVFFRVLSLWIPAEARERD